MEENCFGQLYCALVGQLPTVVDQNKETARKLNIARTALHGFGIDSTDVAPDCTTKRRP
jgi:hypothetical protein